MPRHFAKCKSGAVKQMQKFTRENSKSLKLDEMWQPAANKIVNLDSDNFDNIEENFDYATTNEISEENEQTDPNETTEPIGPTQSNKLTKENEFTGHNEPTKLIETTELNEATEPNEIVQMSEIINTTETIETNDPTRTSEHQDPTKLNGNGKLITNLQDPADWPAVFNDENRREIVILCGNKIQSNLPSRFPRSVYNRSFSIKYFQRNMPNGTLVPRTWLRYSVKFDSVFCICCKVFYHSTDPLSSLLNYGYKNWKHVSIFYS